TLPPPGAPLTPPAATPMALLHGITDLCHGLGLKITIEGVETADQLAIVRSSGKIDKVQGYLFGPALPATAIAEMASRMPPETGGQAGPLAMTAAGSTY
ncbi:MAG: EAL domain-containing protein, partial [Roseitalea porphyridii]|uniref:EAL domain-containing protein n=1 Tax=Roseitalea porphyridii TaxID=1852022 RepID=UPI0032EACBAD